MTSPRSEWLAALQCLMTFPAQDLPQRGTIILDTLKDTDPRKLQGLKHGVVFTPRAVMELVELLKD